MLYDERRLFFRRHLREYETAVLILLKLSDYRVCLERNKMRPKEKWVPEDVIVNMGNHYFDPSARTRTHFDEVKEIYVDSLQERI